MAFETEDEGTVELDIIAVPLTIPEVETEALLVIAENSIDTPEDHVSDLGLSRDMLGKEPDEDSRPTIRYVNGKPSSGKAAIRLLEYTQYQIRLCSGDDWDLISGAEQPIGSVESPLSYANSADWKFDRKSGTGELKVKGYYGSSMIQVGDCEVRLDFVSDRLNYESEYRAMFEDIADHFQALVASWGGPTTYNSSLTDGESTETLIERFVLARGLLERYRLPYASRAVERNPSKRLERNENWRPLPKADPQAFLIDPVHKGRSWKRVDGECLPVNVVPGEVRHAKKGETVDTPANRFVKHVLQQFDSIFRRVVENDEVSGAAEVEAAGLSGSLRDVIERPFWKEVGPLSRVPTRSTLLREREGYRQVFRAWIGLRSALSIDWDGASSLFRGPARNVPDLYEYWLFFGLRRQLAEMDDVEEKESQDQGDIRSLIETKGDRLSVRLQGGKSSVTEFRGKTADSRELCILLFYKRGFGGETKHPGPGSYSKSWEPDFSVVVFPAGYREAKEGWKEAEVLASKAGEISYVHLDAKYKPEGSSRGGLTSGDFAELHAYLDGIHGSDAAFLLHPGKADSPDGIRVSYSRSGNQGEGIQAEIGDAVARPGSANGAQDDGLFSSDSTFLSSIFRRVMNRFARNWHPNRLRQQPLSGRRLRDEADALVRPSAS